MKKKKKRKEVKEQVCDEEVPGRPACFVVVSQQSVLYHFISCFKFKLSFKSKNIIDLHN